MPLRRLYMPFFPQKHKKYAFWEKFKLMCEMLDMDIYGLETETTHPKRLFDNLSFLDFRKNEKKVRLDLLLFFGQNVNFFGQKSVVTEEMQI